MAIAATTIAASFHTLQSIMTQNVSHFVIHDLPWELKGQHRISFRISHLLFKIRIRLIFRHVLSVSLFCHWPARPSLRAPHANSSAHDFAESFDYPMASPCAKASRMSSSAARYQFTAKQPRYSAAGYLGLRPVPDTGGCGVMRSSACPGRCAGSSTSDIAPGRSPCCPHRVKLDVAHAGRRVSSACTGWI